MLGRLIVAFVNIVRMAANAWRAVWRRRVAYVQIALHGAIPEFSAPLTLLQRLAGVQPPLSLHTLRRRFTVIAADPHARGVLLVIDDLEGGWASLQSLRNELIHLRGTGKRVVALLRSADVRSYYVGCAADEILLVPTLTFAVTGVYAEVQFLKDALERFGITAELVAVSPYKSGGDQLARSGFSPEARAQLERVLDARYNELVNTIAAARQQPPEVVRALIDQAPFTARAALEAGLADALCYEDELPARLGSVELPASILEWEQARRALRLPMLRFFPRLVGVVAVEGTIMPGSNRRTPVPIPLIGGTQAGADTIVQALRAAEASRRVKAVVLYVNSPGGSAAASDQIWREVQRLARTKPVVVAMGDAAASGGYYVAAPAAKILAQPATLTGSIGVFLLRPVLGGALARLGVQTETITRGANSGVLISSLPSEPHELETMQRLVFDSYADFKERVCLGRQLNDAQLEPIAGGRVWLGTEALSNGLVDAIGGVPEAMLLAQSLAGLPQDRTAPLLLIPGGRQELLPPPFPAEQPAQLADWLAPLLQPQIWALAPWYDAPSRP